MNILISIPTDQYNEIVYNDIDKLRECVKKGQVVLCDDSCKLNCNECPHKKEESK